jgi:hypothetical protein
MNKILIKQEINALHEFGMPVAYDLVQGVIAIHEFPTPAGWTPETITVVFDLPEYYPYARPTLSVLEPLKNHNDPGTEKRFEECGLLEWDPERHSTLTVLKHFRNYLRNDTSSGSRSEEDDKEDGDTL